MSESYILLRNGETGILTSLLDTDEWPGPRSGRFISIQWTPTAQRILLLCLYLSWHGVV